MSLDRQSSFTEEQIYPLFHNRPNNEHQFTQMTQDTQRSVQKKRSMKVLPSLQAGVQLLLITLEARKSGAFRLKTQSVNT